ncbi:hypothetical protein L905_23430 [Agrobacterium sp. TS43]|nr:hypothetical protein L905_23430 [Agrobacterium sp. TS43]
MADAFHQSERGSLVQGVRTTNERMAQQYQSAFQPPLSETEAAQTTKN